MPNVGDVRGETGRVNLQIPATIEQSLFLSTTTSTAARASHGMTSHTDSLTLNTTLVWSPDDRHHTLTAPESPPRLPPDGHSPSQARHPLQEMADTSDVLSSPGEMPPATGGPDDGKNAERRASASSFDPDDARESEPSPDVNLDFPSTEDVTAPDSGRGMLGVGAGEYVHPLAAAETAPGRVYVPPQSGSVRSRGRVPDPLEVLPFGEDPPHQGGSGSSRRRPPHSSYYNGPPPLDSAYGSDPLAQIGVHFPREILRIERDYSGGELVQFHPTFPLELEGRITPVQHQESMNSINEILISAHQLFPSFLHNTLGILTLYISTLFIPSHYDREMHRLRLLIDQLNREIYNPQGLNILWPQRSAFLFLEIEYY